MISFSITSEMLNIQAGSSDALIEVKTLPAGRIFALEKPAYEIDGAVYGGTSLAFTGAGSERILQNGGREVIFSYSFKDNDNLRLQVFLRYFPDSPILRFRYVLSANRSVMLTKRNGHDNILYTGLSVASEDTTSTESVEITEIQVSQFSHLVHSFLPSKEKLRESELKPGTSFPGPITVIEYTDACCLLAYEHGAEYPDTYLDFYARQTDSMTLVKLHAKKGNYYQGQVVDANHFFTSPWFQFGASAGSSDDLFKHYRHFFLEFICENTESRKPYIFYNTWNYQERNNYFNHRKYLDSMHLDHILMEIDVCHRMGVDVYVIDTGWYEKTGDWVVNLDRFPDGLKEVKKKLDRYGMKLGLWFNPTVAARTSEIFLSHHEYIMSVDGEAWCGSIWETEESYGMCLASGYSDYFIQKLIHLNRELGVSYFKWDGIGQYGCNSPLHNHGTEENSPEERAACYSYQMGLEMIRIVEEVTKACPNVIVDFDVTEGGRFVGLGFLSVGKYFLINNGPYAKDFDFPEQFSYKLETPIPMDPLTNLFFYPGPARARFCRQGTQFDSLIPSILFLTHYLPDQPVLSQQNSLASLMLGGNGIWGDLSVLTQEDIELFYSNLDQYKLVAEAITKSYPIVRGFIGSSPEIYEKIDHDKRKGIVCFFTKSEGTYTYYTEKIYTDRNYSENKDLVAAPKIEGADHWELTSEGSLKITVNLKENEARVVFVL